MAQQSLLLSLSNTSSKEEALVGKKIHVLRAYKTFPKSYHIDVADSLVVCLMKVNCKWQWQRHVMGMLSSSRDWQSCLDQWQDE